MAPAIALGLSFLFLTAASACAPRTSTTADLNAVTTTAQETSRQPVAAAPPIVDEVIVLDTQDRKSLAGRSVALIGVEVQAVNNAYSFWIGPDTGRRALVVVDSTTTSMKPGQNYYAMPKPGQSVAVAGVLQPIPQNLNEVQVRWGLTPLDRARLAISQVYIAANRVMVLDGR